MKKENLPNNDAQLFFVPNNDASTNIGLSLYMSQNLDSIFTAWQILIIFYNFILYFTITQFFMPGVPLRGRKKTFLSLFQLQLL